MSSPLPFRAAAIAGFAAMALAGWKFAGAPAAATPEQSAGTHDQAIGPSKTARTVRNAGPPEHVRQALAAIRNAANPGERMRATIALVNSLPPSELGEWIDRRWFESVPGFDLTLFNKLAAQRWRAEDPEGQLKWAMKSGSGSAEGTINEWAKKDPARLLAFFKENPSGYAEMQALQEIAKSDPDLAIGHLRELMGRFARDDSGGYYTRQVLNELAAKSPGALAAALESFPASQRKQVESALLGEALKKDFASEIRKLWDRPDGLALFQQAASGGTLRGAGDMLAELDSLPPAWRTALANGSINMMSDANAEKWFAADLEGAGFSAEQAQRLRMRAMQNLAYRKPEIAVGMIEELGLEGPERQQMIMRLFSSSRNEEQTKKLLGLLPTEEDRKMAAGLLNQNGEDGGGESVPKIETPADWLKGVQELDSKSAAFQQFAGFLGNWNKEQVAEIAAGFREMPEEKKLAVARMIAANGEYGSQQLASDGHISLQSDSIRYILEHPEGEEASGQRRSGEAEADRLASIHAVRWAERDPDAASQWVQSLPEGKAKLWAQKNVASNWARYDPDAAQRWVASLPAAAREEVGKFMKGDR